ncbi:MAG: hypothetical protein AAF127_07115 [Pseudomonadota bacterium]
MAADEWTGLGLKGLGAALALVSAHAGALAQDAEEPTLAPPVCDYGAPDPDAPDELSQFDFLIGDFTITGRIWSESAWGPEIMSPRARLTGRYILGGRAIQDEWYDRDPGFDPKSTRGVTTRIYDAKAGHWKVSWLSADVPVITRLRVAMEDNVLTMRTISPEKPNYDAVFERDGPDRWTRTAFRTQADGSRTFLWQAIATRIPCPTQ